jgi:GTP pyrophosphokinase
LFYRRLKNWKIPYTDRLLTEILKEYGLSSGIEFYHQIATEKIDVIRLKDFILSLNEDKEVREKPESESVKDKSVETKVGEVCIGNNLNDLAYKVAKCCNPILGEDVIGFISINGGVTIHRKDCNNVKALKKNYPYRIIDVRWSNESDNISSEIAVNIIANNELGLLGAVSNVFKELNINILSANFETKESRSVGNLVLQVSNTNLLEQLLIRLKSITGVIEVKRVK